MQNMILANFNLGNLTKRRELVSEMCESSSRSFRINFINPLMVKNANAPVHLLTLTQSVSPTKVSPTLSVHTTKSYDQLVP